MREALANLKVKWADMSLSDSAMQCCVAKIIMNSLAAIAAAAAVTGVFLWTSYARVTRDLRGEWDEELGIFLQLWVSK